MHNTETDAEKFANENVLKKSILDSNLFQKLLIAFVLRASFSTLFSNL